MHLTRLKFAASSALMALALLCSCDQKEKKLPDTKVSEWLGYCAPFMSLDGTRMLWFSPADHSMELVEAVGEERAQGALLAKKPMTTPGTWVVDETTKTVTVELAGAKMEYTLVVPFDEAQCLLVTGSVDAANLRESWFGEPDFSER